MRTLFQLGSLLATPGALAALAEANSNPLVWIIKHAAGDWGQLDAHDMKANAEALKHGGRILSAYVLGTGMRIWLITEAQDDEGTGKQPQFCCLLNTEQLTIWDMKAGVLLTCMLVCTIGCENRTAQSAAPTPTPRLVALPTASEIFNLRSKCAELADKILENNFVGSALTQEVTSHYNPETNRCYVELNVHAADLSQYDEHPNLRYLYDGQTKDLLANTKREKGGKRSGNVFDGGNLGDWDKATAKIDSLMADDRKQ